MKNHKRILLSLVFMLLFVQSTLYFSGSQLLLGAPEGKRTVCSSQERKKVPSVTVPMSAKHTPYGFLSVYFLYRRMPGRKKLQMER